MSQRPPEELPPEDERAPENAGTEGQTPEEERSDGEQPAEGTTDELSPEEELLEEDEYFDEEDEEEEHLSGTLLSGLHQATQGLGGYGAALFGGGIFAVILGGIVYLLISDLRLYGSIIMGIGAALLLLGIITSWSSVRSILGARRGRYGVNSVLMVTAFLGIIAVVSFLLFDNAWRFDVTATNQFSLATRTKNLLSNLEYDVKATAFFVEEDPRLPFVENLLKEFEARSNRFSYEVIDPDRNPQTAQSLGVSPQTGYGNTVFECTAPSQDCQLSETGTPRMHLVPTLLRERAGIPSNFLEQDFVTALLIVTGEQQKKIYFLTGHRERSTTDGDSTSDGYGVAASLGLRGENYAVDDLSLLGSEPRVPEDATLVVIAGPQRDFFALGEDSEIAALEDYLQTGGRMLVLLDPEEKESGDEGMKDFHDFLARWGVQVLPGHIVDQQSLDEAGRSPLVLRDRFQYGWEYLLGAGCIEQAATSTACQQSFSVLYGGGLGGPSLAQLATSAVTITRGLDATYYPGAVALRPTKDSFFFPPEGPPPADPESVAELKTFSVVTLALSSPASFRIEELDRDEPIVEDCSLPNASDEDSGQTLCDERGPFYIALAVRPSVQALQELQDPDESEGPFIVVIGDSDFASNRNFYGEGASTNSDFFLNTVNWLTGDVSLVDIRPKPFTVRQLRLDEDQRDWVRYSSWFLLPVAMVLIAGIVWWRRR